MTKDPVCKMDVDETKAKHLAQHEGKTYYFCSSSCKDKFEEDPAEFVPQG
jgi:P-type Cu+ transporter